MPAPRQGGCGVVRRWPVAAGFLRPNRRSRDLACRQYADPSIERNTAPVRRWRSSANRAVQRQARSCPSKLHPAPFCHICNAAADAWNGAATRSHLNVSQCCSGGAIAESPGTVQFSVTHARNNRITRMTDLLRRGLMKVVVIAGPAMLPTAVPVEVANRST